MQTEKENVSRQTRSKLVLNTRNIKDNKILFTVLADYYIGHTNTEDDNETAILNTVLD